MAVTQSLSPLSMVPATRSAIASRGVSPMAAAYSFTWKIAMDGVPRELRVVVNWFEELERVVPQ